MRNLIAISTTLMLFVFMAACTRKEKVLIEIQASEGQIEGDRNTGYQLILEEPHNTVIWFSDRPIRQAGFIHIRDFLEAWDAGKDSFERNPPNAVLIIDNSYPVVVELILVSWNESKAVFKLKGLEGQESKIYDKSGPTLLFIDTIHIDVLYFNEHSFR